MKFKSSNFSYFDLLFITGVLIFGSVPFAHAWNGPGHMLVADIAWLALAGVPSVRNKIQSILRNAKGGFEPAGTTDDQTRDAFGYAATFADAIKTADATEYEQLVLKMNPLFWPGGQPEPGAGNEGVRCKSWHFFDTPINVPGGAERPVFASNLKKSWEAANINLKALVGNRYSGPMYEGFNKSDLKFWWFAWILHLAGDAHQPLHCVSNFAFNAETGDAGGNRFLLNGHNSLHSFWDGLLVRTASADGFHIAGAQTTNSSSSALLAPVSDDWSAAHPATGAQLANLNMDNWIEEAKEAALAVTYHGVHQGQSPDEAYISAAEDFARLAAVRAGQRLAAVLQEIFS